MNAAVNYLLENKTSFILSLADSTCLAQTELNTLSDVSVLSDLETDSHSHSLIQSREMHSAIPSSTFIANHFPPFTHLQGVDQVRSDGYSRSSSIYGVICTITDEEVSYLPMAKTGVVSGMAGKLVKLSMLNCETGLSSEVEIPENTIRVQKSRLFFHLDNVHHIRGIVGILGMSLFQYYLREFAICAFGCAISQFDTISKWHINPYYLVKLLKFLYYSRTHEQDGRVDYHGYHYTVYKYALEVVRSTVKGSSYGQQVIQSFMDGTWDDSENNVVRLYDKEEDGNDNDNDNEKGEIGREKEEEGMNSKSVDLSISNLSNHHNNHNYPNVPIAGAGVRNTLPKAKRSVTHLRSLSSLSHYSDSTSHSHSHSHSNANATATLADENGHSSDQLSATRNKQQASSANQQSSHSSTTTATATTAAAGATASTSGNTPFDPSPIVISSLHPSFPKTHYSDRICVQGAAGLRVLFDPRCHLEEDKAFLSFFTDEAMRESIARFTGTGDSWRAFSIRGDTLHFRYESDLTASNQWGYAFVVQPFQNVFWNRECDVLNESCFEWNCESYAVLLSLSKVWEYKCDDFFNRTLGNLVEYLRTSGMPFKSRVVSLLMQLMMSEGIDIQVWPDVR